LHGAPRTITVDHGTKFTSCALDEWAYRRGITLDFIRPGKPTEDGGIEAWRVDYNLHRPHSSLGQLSPREYLRRSGIEGKEAANFQLRTDPRRDQGQPWTHQNLGWRLPLKVERQMKYWVSSCNQSGRNRP
jgi:Integrase core domain